MIFERCSPGSAREEEFFCKHMASTAIESWMALGEYLWEATYGQGCDDLSALNAIASFAAGLVKDIDSALITTSGLVPRLTFLAKWADSAFTNVTVNDKYAAALMATSASLEAVGTELRSPWSAFTVIVPSGLLGDFDRVSVVAYRGYPEFDARGQLLANASIFVHSPDEALHHHDKSLAVALTEPPFCNGGDGLWDRLTDSDARVMQLAKRLAIGCILAAGRDDARVTITKGSGGGRGRCRHRVIPPQRTVVIGRPIDLDVRTAVRDHVSHGGSAPSVQTLVRGHYKTQLHGRARSLRKTIWVYPYWRGPDDGPIKRADYTLSREVAR